MWFTNFTFAHGGPERWGNEPWKAPGTAPLYSPCGIEGGNPLGCPVGEDGQCGAGGWVSRQSSFCIPAA